ncbi:hypothetical protein BX666DRAFT_943218 [Dichotomocladium elegans]|nr:hypothetical protein BX666DRAFT_943218 [Dichotomocladium elegans]
MKKQSASQQLSDSELSLQLSDASTLSSDSEPEDAHNDRRFSDTKSLSKKRSTNTKTKNPNRRRSSAGEKLYCVCRKGYDGKEFMIACDGCQEWFHGRCVDVKPKSVTDHYFCDACSKAKSRKSSTAATGKGRKGKTKRKSKKRQQPSPSLPPPPPPPLPLPPSIPENATSLSCDEEDLDDICPVCDTECTCGVEVKNSNGDGLVATDPWQVTNEKTVVERVGVEEDESEQQKQQPAEDVEVDVSDQDFLFDDGKSTSYTSSIHIDSGDDEGLEKEEEEAIIRDMMENGSDDSGDTDSEDDLDEDEEEEEDEVYYYADDTDHGEDDQQIDDHDPYYPLYLVNGWSTSDEEEEEDSDNMEEDQEDPIDRSEVVLPSGSDDQKRLFDSIATAFMEILAPLVDSSTTAEGVGSGDHTDMASLLGIAPPVDQLHNHITRRLSLPSSAVTDAVTHDHPEKLALETLSAMPVLQPDLSLPLIKEESMVANDSAPALPLIPDTTSLQYDAKLQEHLLELVQKRSNAAPVRHIMPKPSESTETSDKKRSLSDPCMTGKKPRLSSPPSSPTEIESPVIPVSMDELVDTSQLYTRSTSRSPSPEPDELDTQLSRDLSRWQRVPIGAFRLMRSKNKLWLER